jgi:hypothetical protein
MSPEGQQMTHRENRQTGLRGSRLLSIFLLGLAACGGSDGGTLDVADLTDTVADTTTNADDTRPVEFDTAPFTPDDTTPQAPDTSPGGDFGVACQGNIDCNSGWCVEGPSGYICTKECLEDCPTGFDCRSIQNTKGDVTFLCLPRVQKLCVPCLADFQCNGGACLTIDGEQQCASGCDAEDDCPDGYTCAADATGAREGTYCQPKSGSCACSPPFAGVARSCLRENDLGRCVGVETCDPEVGWVGCSAREASAETCDYVDNDCDGDIDEDFKQDGIYASAETCGSCTTACDDVLANASETECKVDGGVARCQVVTCERGFSPLNPYVCAPDAANSCQPCTTVAECVGVGASCTTLDDGRFCTRACASNDDCIDGFACRDTDQGKQCVPASGSCTCDGRDTNLARACAVTYTPPDPEDPEVTCRGLERCTADGWGECELPVESCDGIDNDCDGIVDGPFKTGGKYTTPEHCGACGLSCLAFARPNATPVCDASSVVPQCSYACSGGAVDVNGRSDDGCECVPVAGSDLAGDDLDSNCDGVDGEVNNAIFVSKEGRDNNPGTLDLPLQTVQAGITKAAADNKRDVYVATGVYSESISLGEGVGVFGGYSPDFDVHDVLLYETALIGPPPTAQKPGTVNATNLGASNALRDTVLDGFTVFGVNAANTVGLSSYAVYLNGCGPKLRVSKNRIFAGPGGSGQAGARGTNGATGINGTAGAAAKNLTANCAVANESSGGAGGARSCGATDVGGGAGGRAGCPVFEVSPVGTSKGANGKGASGGAGGSFGWPLFLCAVLDDLGVFPMCYGETVYYDCGTCYLPQDQKPFSAGGGSNGASGSAGAAGVGVIAGAGSVVSGLWVGSAGGAGGTGTHGSGGGGGGAGGGVEVEGTSCASASNDDVGGSGGGGGSGGCGATGGAGGSSGGGSFGIFITGLTGLPTLTGNTIQGGRGGAGGSGGPGGVGGAAGQGAAGGNPGDAAGNQNVQCAEGGGAGGNGGEGGHGGGGGGGAGGPSYGVFASLTTAAPATWKTGNTFAAGAQGGAGGLGGVSVDPAKTGGNGQAGSAGNANF